MNTAHHHYHNRNSGDLDALHTLAAHATHLDSLPMEDFSALAEVFRIGAQGAEVGREVRRVLLEALVLEREHFAGYLQLPKFKTLPARTIIAIQGYWQHLWTAFTAQKENEGKSKEGVMVAEGAKEVPRVSSSPFDYYRAYQTYPKFGLEQPKMAYSPFPYYYNFQNYPYAQPYHPHQTTPLPTPTPPIKIPTTPTLAPIPIPTPAFYKPDPQPEPESIMQKNEKDVEKAPEKQQKPEKEKRQKEKDKSKEKQKGDRSEKGDVTMKGMDSNSQSKAKSLNKKQHDFPKKQPQLPKKQPQPPKKDPKKQREPSPPKQPQGPRSNIINLRFLHCACFGHTISTSQKSFECHQCRNLFHYSCLHLSSSDGRSCPFCTLSRHHAFTEALPRPIKSGWFEVGNKDCFVTKLHLDADQLGTFRKHMALLEKDKENVHAIEFRILRINEKSKVKPGRKIIKTSFPLLPNELRKIEARHWIQLKLKQITEPSLIFYLMTMIRLKDRTRIHQDYRVLEVIKTPLVGFWAQQEKQAGKKLQVRMTHPVTGKALQLPVRGESCQHLECEDLLFFYEQYQLSAFDGTNRLQCSHCNKPYTPHSKFTADPVMHALLQTRPPGSKRLRLENGKVEWVPVESSGSEVQEGEESGSAS